MDYFYKEKFQEVMILRSVPKITRKGEEKLFIEIVKFVLYAGLVVLIAKYILVKTLRRLAENLNLKPKTVGDMAGYATSIPELLTISVSSMNGLISTSIFNVISSNVINLIQYVISIVMNKNRRAFSNPAIRIDLFLVFLTIAIPIVLIFNKIEISLWIVPAFLILYALFQVINQNVHKVYLEELDQKLAKKIEEEGKKEEGNTRKTVLYMLILLGTGVLLYGIGELLGETLENLCNRFEISQVVIGILLGFITSIPELITFFEAQKHHKEKGQDNMLGVVEATNNLLTSNVLNLFMIQSIGILMNVLFL